MSDLFKPILVITIVSSFIVSSVFAVTTKESASLRVEPSNTSPTYGVIGAGNTVDVIEEKGQWTKVEFQGTTGYVDSNSLDVALSTTAIAAASKDIIIETTEAKATAIPEVVSANDETIEEPVIVNETYLYTTDKVNLREGQGENTPSLDIIARDTKVLLIEAGETWDKVSYENLTGYIRKDFVTETVPEIYKYTTSKVNLRKNPGTDADILETVPLNTKVLILETGSEWSKATYNEKTGYIINTFLSNSAIEVPEEYMYTTSSVNFRSDAGTDSEKIKLLSINTKVVILEKGVEWNKVKVDGVEGYISNEFLSNEAISKSSTTLKKMTTTANVNLRSDTSTDSNVITVVRNNTAVEILEENGEFNKVEANGKVGYMSKEYLTEYVEGTTVDEAAEIVVNSGGVEDLSWQEIKAGNLFPTGVDARVLDLYTGKVYYVRSFSNGNHADVEPVTTDDTSIMKSTFGGVWSWDVRPVLVTINGHSLAGSINGQPHGGGVNSGNGMEGQVCIHFRGSTVHNGNTNFAALHQKVASEALSLARK